MARIFYITQIEIDFGAVKLLPQYEPDDGPLTTAQLRQIKKRAPQGGKRSIRSIRSSLFETETA